MAIGAPGVGLAARISEAQRKKDVNATPGIKEVVTHDLDLSNAAQDTLATTNQTLDRYPDLAGMWTICDFCVPLMAQATDTKGLTGAKRPLVTGMFTTPQTLTDIRKGIVAGVVELRTRSWSRWTRRSSSGPATSRSTRRRSVTKAYSLEFLQPYILTKANVGASGTPALQGPDFVTYFKTKWQLEFGSDAAAPKAGRRRTPRPAAGTIAADTPRCASRSTQAGRSPTSSSRSERRAAALQGADDAARSGRGHPRRASRWPRRDRPVPTRRCSAAPRCSSTARPARSTRSSPARRRRPRSSPPQGHPTSCCSARAAGRSRSTIAVSTRDGYVPRRLTFEVAGADRSRRRASRPLDEDAVLELIDAPA